VTVEAGDLAAAKAEAAARFEEPGAAVVVFEAP
jgi:hypothetical protein